MAREKKVGTLGSRNAFRSWLMSSLGSRISDPNSPINVYKIKPSSHTVCRYEFPAEGFSVVAKFYGEPTGWKRDYDPVVALEKEFNTLKKIEQIVDIPRPLAMHRDFHCALLTEYVQGRSLYKCVEKDDSIYDRLTAIARTQRKLHSETRSYYRKDRVFAKFHRVLDQLRLGESARMKYNRLLGRWWHSQQLDLPFGCRVHGDANPMNYLFNHDRVYIIDFESSKEHVHHVQDLGLIAAELKHFFAVHRRRPELAEPYIGHYIWKYSHSEQEFQDITRILPFFMCLGWLRMARLGMAMEDRAYVLREAEACMRSGPGTGPDSYP